MEEKELNSLVQVIKNKIIQDSIILLEMRFTYSNQKMDNYNKIMHYVENISESAIKKNIMNGTDLHIIDQRSISGFITSDLNAFFKEMVSFRRSNPFLDESFILKADESVLLSFISDYLKYHTYEENLKLKKLFLKRYNISFPEMKDEAIERLFFNAFSSLYIEVTENHSRSI